MPKVEAWVVHSLFSVIISTVNSFLFNSFIKGHCLFQYQETWVPSMTDLKTYDLKQQPILH